MFDNVKEILAKQLRIDPELIRLESHIIKDLGTD